MNKQATFQSLLLPLLLIFPQAAIVLIFFYWPAAQTVWQSFLQQDAFGLSTTFVGLANYLDVLVDPLYFQAALRTFIFSFAIAALSLSIALLLAVMADKPIAASGVYRTLLVTPYAIAAPVAGVLWVFMLHPSIGILSHELRAIGVDWNPLLRGDQAILLVVLASTWKQISYNFLFFLAGLQAIPRSVLEAASVDGARPVRRFWTVTFPLLMPTVFFLIIINIVYAFFDTFGIIDAMTGGGPAKATETLLFKVYSDGLLGGNLGGSAAQSVILMIAIVVLSAIQFRFVERKVTY
jgi:sn-glycerol 3-phosphate transport system permease protein